jgi:hypothetical protein
MSRGCVLTDADAGLPAARPGLYRNQHHMEQKMLDWIDAPDAPYILRELVILSRGCVLTDADAGLPAARPVCRNQTSLNGLPHSTPPIYTA